MWPPKQQAAIATRLHGTGKNNAEISAFFHKHGYGADKLKKRKGKPHKRRHGALLAQYQQSMNKGA